MKMSCTEQRVAQCYAMQPYPNVLQGSHNPENVICNLVKWINSNFTVLGVNNFFPTNILVAGCGTGEEVIALSRIFPLAKITAIDITPASLTIAKNNLDMMNVSNVDLRQMSIIEDLPKDAKQYDLIFCSGVIHHLSDPEVGFSNLVNKVSLEGKLVVNLYNSYALFYYRIQQLILNLVAGSEFERRKKWAIRFGFDGGKNDVILYDSYVNPKAEIYSIGTVYKWGKSRGINLTAVSPPLTVKGLINFGIQNQIYINKKKKFTNFILSLLDHQKINCSYSYSFKYSWIRTLLFQLLFLIFQKGECWYLFEKKRNN